MSGPNLPEGTKVLLLADVPALTLYDLSRCLRSLEVRIRLCEEDLERYRSRLERHDTEA